MKIVIVDYGTGNLRSVAKAVSLFTSTVKISSAIRDIQLCDKLILPGVGAFGQAINNLRKLKLILPIQNHINRHKPFFGICLGLQLLFTQSEEGGLYRGLDIFKGKVVRFKYPPKKKSIYKIPQIGWNQIHFISLKKGTNTYSKFNYAEKNHQTVTPNLPYFNGIPNHSYFYFVHSYFVVPVDKTVVATVTDYGMNFGIAFQIVDDYLDIMGDEDSLGKALGQDIAMGEITLPVYDLFNSLGKKERGELKQIILSRNINSEVIKKIRDKINRQKISLKIKERILSYVCRSKHNLARLKDSCFREKLMDLADYLVERGFGV
jgi:glutamine amidotransferase